MKRNAYADREAIFAALDAADAAQKQLAACSLDGLSSEEVLEVLSRRETLAWQHPSFDHRLLARLIADGNPGKLGAASLSMVLQERLRVSRSVARRRLAETDDLGPRSSLDGQPLEPKLPAIAAAQAAGRISPEHVEIARDIYAKIPAAVTAEWREYAQAELAELAMQYGPAMFRRLGEALLTVLDPDGDFADRQRQNKRGLRLGPQQRNGMSRLSGELTPEARATLEPLLAKLAAPGMCNPADEHPCLSGTPAEAQIRSDQRTPDQRNHDALVAVMRAMLASGDLGRHNGLPVTVIVTTTLAELNAAARCGAALEPTDAGLFPKPDTESPVAKDSGDRRPAAGAGWAITAAGSRLPMSDLLRMASHAVHYLSIFDGRGRALWLGRSKRIASADQRIVLFARDRGCTRPGCPANGYHCQAHHLEPWRDSQETTIDGLGLACEPDNLMADKFGWTTELNEAGRVEWHPPPILDRGQSRINHYHFPEDLLADLRRRRSEARGGDDPGPPPAPYPPTAPGGDPPGTAPTWWEDAVESAGWMHYFDETNAELDEYAAIHHPDGDPELYLYYDIPGLIDEDLDDLIARDPERHLLPEKDP